MTTIYRYSKHKPKPFEVVNTLKKLQQALEPEGLSPALDDHQLFLIGKLYSQSIFRGQEPAFVHFLHGSIMTSVLKSWKENSLSACTHQFDQTYHNILFLKCQLRGREGRGGEGKEGRKDGCKQASQENPIETETLMQRVDIPLTPLLRSGGRWG